MVHMHCGAGVSPAFFPAWRLEKSPAGRRSNEESASFALSEFSVGPIRIAVTNNGLAHSLWGHVGFQLRQYGSLPSTSNRSNESANCRERQPERRHGPVSGLVDEVGANRRSKSAKNRRRQTERQGKTGGANLRRHDFREVWNHRSVVHSEKHGQP